MSSLYTIKKKKQKEFASGAAAGEDGGGKMRGSWLGKLQQILLGKDKSRLSHTTQTQNMASRCLNAERARGF